MKVLEKKHRSCGGAWAAGGALRDGQLGVLTIQQYSHSCSESLSQSNRAKRAKKLQDVADHCAVSYITRPCDFQVDGRPLTYAVLRDGSGEKELWSFLITRLGRSCVGF